ncbi:MAG: hypothetical protein KHX03_09620 [Clostridium sp.]|nr:hypothetical protein [Clostridium sp.]
MSNVAKFWKQVQTQSKAQNPDVVALCQVKSLKPFVFDYKGIEISIANGDNIYIDPLILQANINLDVAGMDSAQNINPALWKADNTPTGTVEISGSQKQFLTDFYNFFKSWQGTYILSVGDYVTVQRLGFNTYLVIRKAVELE